MMTKRNNLDPAERLGQLYDDLRTARLNELYYTDRLSVWSKIIGTNDLLIAFGTAASPVAFWKASSDPGLHITWIILSVVTFALGALKPTLSLQDRLKVYSELKAQYCELFYNLHELRKEAAARQSYTDDIERQFVLLGRGFGRLAAKDRWKPRHALLEKLQLQVNKEIPPESLWMPDEEESSSERTT
jgi:hypothetical protein